MRPGSLSFLNGPLGTGEESEVRVGDVCKSDTGQLLGKGHNLHVRNPLCLGFPRARRGWHQAEDAGM